MRIVILLTLFLAASTASFSQKQFIGLKAGPGFTNVGGDFFEDSEMRIGLNIGVTYDYFLSDNLSLGAEITYSQRGFRDDFFSTSQGDTEIADFNYDYIALPLKISYSGNANFYGFASAGLIPAFLVNAKTKIPPIAGNEASTEDVKDRVASVDIAAMIEVGAGYSLAERYRIFVSASGQLSINKFSSDEYFADEGLRHYGFVLTVGIKYAIAR